MTRVILPTDFDSSTSCLTSNTDIERIANYEQKISNLEEQNNILLNENTTLKAQYQHALDLSSKKSIDNYDKEENIKSKIQIKSLNEQLNDLKNKMKSIVESKESEIKAKLEEINSVNERYACLQHSSNREITKMRQKYDSKIDQLYKDNQKLTKEMSRQQYQFRAAEAKVDRLLKLTSRKTGTELPNIDILINIIEENPLICKKLFSTETNDVQPPTCIAISSQDKNYECNIFERFPEMASISDELNNLKARNKNYKKRIDELTEELEKTIESGGKKNSQITKELSEAKTKIIELQHELEKSNDDRVIIQENANHQVRLLETKISSLKEEIERNKKQEPYVLAQQPIPLQPYYPPEPAKKTENDYINDELRDRIDELSNQISKLTSERDDYKSKFDSTQNETKVLKNDIKNICSQFQSIKNENAELNNEIDRLKRDIIGKDKEIQEKSKARKKNKKLAIELQGSVNSLLNTIEHQKRDIFDKQLMIDSLNSKIELLNKEVKIAKDKCDDFEILAKNVPEKVIQLPPQVIEQPIPFSAWNIDGIPYELNVLIQDIGRSPSLMFHSKIQSAITKVCKYYQKQVKEQKKNNVEISRKYETLKTKVNDFVVDVSVTIQGQPMNYKDFETGRVHQLISRIPIAYKDEKNNLIQTVSDLQQKLAKISVHSKTLFGIENVHKALDHASTTIESIKSQLDQTAKLLKKTQEAIPEKVIIDTTPEIEVLNKNIQLQESVIKQQKNQISELQQNIRELEYQIEELKRNHKNEIDDIKLNFDNEKAQIQNDMNEEIMKVTSTLNYTSDTLEEYKHEISRLKNALSVQKQTISDLEQQKAKIEAHFNDLIGEIKEANENDRRDIIEQYHKTISDMSNKYKEQQLDLERVQKDLEYSEKKRKHDKNKISEARREINKLNMVVADQAEYFDRERKFFEASKNNTVLNENTSNEKLQKFDSQKNEISDFVPDDSSDFNDECEDKDELFLRSLIKKVKNNLDRLQKSENYFFKSTTDSIDTANDD